MEIVIVGAGLVGAYFSRELAERGHKVTILEKRSHIGGNMYDKIDEETGCRIQVYGPHIFHTSDEWAWRYLNQYTSFTPYKLTTEVFFHEYGKYIKGPFNLRTVEELFPDWRAMRIKSKLLDLFNIDLKEPPQNRTVSIVQLKECPDSDIQELYRILWENDYKLYSAKQWGIDPEQVDPNILSRVPFYCSYWDGIFSDRYQGIPTDGYTKLFENLLDHENIHLTLGENALEDIQIKEDVALYKGKEVLLVWTGAIDELFGFCYGDLPYKTVDFTYGKAKHTQATYGDPCSTILPEQQYSFTRITNYGRLPIQNHLAVDVLLYEQPRTFNKETDKERYYPISSKEDKALYEKYKKRADSIRNLTLAGRLAEYKYYDMDKALLSAKETLDKMIVKYAL